MNIKFSTRFFTKTDGRLHLRLKYGNRASGRMDNCIDFFVGCRVERDKWNAETETPKRNTTHKVGKHCASAAEITRAQGMWVRCVELAVKFYEVADTLPTTADFKAKVNELLIGEGVREDKPAKSQTAADSLNDFNTAIDTFVEEGKALKGWQPDTYKKFVTLRNNLNAFRSDLRISDFNRSLCEDFQMFLLGKKSARGQHYRNTTIMNDFVRLRWFLNWCKVKGLAFSFDAAEYPPKLRDVENKEVVFLSLEEFLRVYNCEIPESKNYLKKARDLFVFQCATGLRYADLAALTRSQIQNGCIRIVTQKTSHALEIRLNKYAKEVLAKYDGMYFEGDKALPVITNQKLNAYIGKHARLFQYD